MQYSGSVHAGKNGDFRKNRGMDVNESVLQGLADTWVAPKLKELVRQEVDRCKLVMLFR